MASIRRNEPCPCGSGRKFKHCCARVAQPVPAGRDETRWPWLIEPPGPEAPYEDVDREPDDDSTGLDLDLLEELLLRHADMRRLEMAPRDDLHGLSADQMHLFLTCPFDCPEVATFADRLQHDPETPFSRLFDKMSLIVSLRNPNPTAKGHLPVRTCREIADLTWGPPVSGGAGLRSDTRSESEFRDLHIVRIVAQLAGCLRKYNGRFIVGRECRSLMRDHGVEAVYPRLLRTYALKFNWAYGDIMPDHYVIQETFLFTLYLLSKYGDAWRSVEFYEDQFLRAFPGVLEEIDGPPRRLREFVFRIAYRDRTIKRFAEFFGLVETEPDETTGTLPGYRVRATPLLSEVVTFRV